MVLGKRSEVWISAFRRGETRSDPSASYSPAARCATPSLRPLAKTGPDCLTRPSRAPKKEPRRKCLTGETEGLSPPFALLAGSPMAEASIPPFSSCSILSCSKLAKSRYPHEATPDLSAQNYKMEPRGKPRFFFYGTGGTGGNRGPLDCPSRRKPRQSPRFPPFPRSIPSCSKLDKRSPSRGPSPDLSRKITKVPE